MMAKDGEKQVIFAGKRVEIDTRLIIDIKFEGKRLVINLNNK